MESNNKHFNSLLQLFLPPELFEYFEIILIGSEGKEVHVHLDELNIKPDVFAKEKLISKGFHAAVIIHDFPIPDKDMFLHVRRRRWMVESSCQVISRDWDTVAKGTRLTKGFAAFLKGILG